MCNKKINLYLPIEWCEAILVNDLSNLSEREKYKFMDFMDFRYLVHGKFTPISVDKSKVIHKAVHDGIKPPKGYVESIGYKCYHYKFLVEHEWGWHKIPQSV